MNTTDPRLLTWLGSPWSRECDICGVVTTDPERTARHKAWHALVDVLIGAFSKPGDDLAEGGRNDTAVVRDGGDGAGKGSTARFLPPLAGADASDVSVEGRSENGAQNGAQSLGDGPRPPESQLGRWIRALNVAATDRDERAVLARFADDIDADYTRVATEHGVLTAERDEARRARKVSQDLARQARTTADAIQQATRERAEYAEQQRDEAEAAVARVRAVVDARTSLCDTPRDPCPCHDGVDVADVLAALDGVDAGGEGK